MAAPSMTEGGEYLRKPGTWLMIGGGSAIGLGITFKIVF